MLYNFDIYDRSLTDLESSKLLINTINAHSYNTSTEDKLFNKVLNNSHVILPDGVSIVLAIRLLTGKRLKKIAGEDLFYYEMNRLQQTGGKVFFMGSTETTLAKISKRARAEFPNISIKTYSPPYKSEFSDEENQVIITEINTFQPDVLFIGMTAPKQEKWAYKHFRKLKVGHVCGIGAVFDFYAQNIKRAPKWMINLGIEWLYRLLKEPKRMWRRYLIGNTKFVIKILKEKLILNLYSNYSSLHKFRP